jgi:DinB superfamily
VAGCELTAHKFRHARSKAVNELEQKLQLGRKIGDPTRCGHASCIAVYDTPLTIEQVLTQLKEQPEAIAAFAAGLPQARLHSPLSEGEWSVNDVLAHLRSCADMWGKYIATIIAEDRPTFRAMNPTTWIKSTNYPELEFAPSFRAFAQQRAELLALLRPLPKAAWSRSATVTGAGRPRDRTVLEYARWLANHERTHLKQIARIVSG